MRTFSISIDFVKKILLLLFVTSIFYWIVKYSTTKIEYEVVKEKLPIIEPYFLAINVIIIFSFFLLSFNDILDFLRKIDKKTWIILFLIFALGFFSRFFITPHTHRIYFDEDIYLDIAKEILIRWRGALCNNGDNFTCYEYDTMKWPNGHTFFLAISYLFFGISESIAFNIIAFISSLGIIIIFLIGYLLKNEKLGLFSALIYALIPVQIQWSGTVAAETTLAVFTLLSVFFLLLSSKKNNWNLFFLGLSVLAYSVQAKAEGVFLIPVATILILLFDKNLKIKFFDNKFIASILMFFVLITPYLIHIVYASKVDTWGSDEGKFGIKFAKRNIPENLIFFVNGYYQIEHPLMFTDFAIIGAIYILIKDRRVFVFLFVWFSVFFLLYGFFYAGSTRYGADVRYMLS
ncbi:MAG: glycosyltransferase family 39 protein, partial [Fervidobacterium sp.]